MATYVLPQVQVFQEFSIAPVAAANPLRAHVSGGHAQLIRYAQDSEREQGDIGYYDELNDNAYDWPMRPAGGIVDDSYVKLWMKDALLRYFEDTIGEGSVITKTAGYNNRIRSASISFAVNGGAARSAALFDRDVKPGDIAKVRGIDTDTGDPVTLWTYVKSLMGDVVVAEVGAAYADDSNATNQSINATVVQTAGPLNCVTATASAVGYDGLASGFITETYDLIVTEGSIDGDFTTAVLRVISGSGTDDQTAVEPSANGVATAIGTRGGHVTLATTPSAGCSASASVDAVSPEDLHPGQRFRVTFHQAFTAPTATSGGSYTGVADTTYIVTVVRGGHYLDAQPPLIKVSTVNGVDLSGPTEITAASTLVDIGSLGTEFEWGGLYLRKGDIYYVDVTAQASGAMHSIVLGHNLPDGIIDGAEVDLTLFIRVPLLQIAENRENFAPETNWDVSETQITVNSGIIAYEASWTNNNVPQPLDVLSAADANYGKLFVETRYWLPSLSFSIGGISDVSTIDTQIPGALDPDNPLKWGVFKALENSNGTEVRFTSVKNPDDPDSWVDVLALLVGSDVVYGLVPLTRDRTVLDLYAAHVKAMSSPEQGLWRVLWTNLESLPAIPIVAAGSAIPGHTTATTTDGAVCLAVVEDDPLSTGSQYTIVRVTSGNGQFVENGVEPGDIVRLLFTGDGFGNVTYSSFQVDEVQSEDQIRLLVGPDAPVNVAAKIEIWRNLNADEEAQAIAINAGSWGDRRVRATWPDQIESSGTVMEGYFLNCSLAGLCSGVLPQQGLTHLQIVGYTSVTQTTQKFNRTQLDLMAGSGVWIVTQDMTGLETDLGEIFTRHAVTTGPYSDLNQREEMLTRNVDSISFRFEDYFKPYIGVTNVTPVVQARLGLDVTNLISILKSEGALNLNVGPQIVDATLIDLHPHAIELDRYVLNVQLVVPYPFNVFEIHLMI